MIKLANDRNRCEILLERVIQFLLTAVVVFLLPDSSRTKEGQSIIIIISESARIFVRHDFSSGIHNNVDVPPRALLRPKTTVPPY